MISPEKRDIKPYTIPVQCIPYHRLKDSAVRSIINKLVKEMHDRGMIISGNFSMLLIILRMILFSCTLILQG